VNEIVLSYSSRGDTAEEVLRSLGADYRHRAFDRGGRMVQQLAAEVVSELRRIGEWNGERVYVLLDWDGRRVEVTNDARTRLLLMEAGWRIAASCPRDER